MPDKKPVKEYYDSLVKKQVDIGVNDRIYNLYKRMKSLGLKSTSNVLELGSGVGVLTYLLSKTVKQGKIEAIELSEESSKYAQKRLTQANITSINADVVTYKSSLTNIDFITLFDVIEHIPIEEHDALFKNITEQMNDKSLLLINVPNPELIKYYRATEPENLQVIDQAIEKSLLIHNLEKNGLNLISFQKNNIWLFNDFLFYVIEKKRKFEYVKLAEKRSFFEKVKTRLRREKVKWFYKY